MSELRTVVHLRAVRKSYRRFRRQGWRILDALGISVPRGCYDNFSALDGISLSIETGERVALIGRNGAGKSTLLRAIAGQIAIDSGELAVRGSVQALMELGSGFHPDFTGLENIRAALALQGVAGRNLSSCIEDIVEFSELESFIARPVCEYSAGMFARLAFATSTAVRPDLLIVDEILGAGDAYFLGKCIQRIRDLAAAGTTMLFVSHDLSSVQLLCDRAVWIRSGLVMADGPVLEVSKAYLADIREEEERRLATRSLVHNRQRASSRGRSLTSRLRCIGLAGLPPSSPFRLAHARLGVGARVVATVDAVDTDTQLCFGVDPQEARWSAAMVYNGVSCREYGSTHGAKGHGPLVLNHPESSTTDTWVELRCVPSETDPVALERFDPESGDFVRLCIIDAQPLSREWQTVRAPWLSADPSMTPGRGEGVSPTRDPDRYGIGVVRIVATEFIDCDNRSRLTFETGRPARVRIHFKAHATVRGPVFVVALYRPDGTCALQAVSNRDGTEFGEISGEGIVDVVFEPLLLGPGEYVVSIAIFRELNLASNTEPDAYELHDRCLEIRILPPPGINVDYGVVNQPCRWQLAT